MRRQMAILAALLPALGCGRDPAPSPEPAATEYRAPSAVELDAIAARLEPCVLPVVDTTTWRREPLRAGSLSIRLPRHYVRSQGTAEPGAASESWQEADSGYVTIATDAELGATYVLQPDGRPIGATESCSLPLFGHRAQVFLLAVETVPRRDTVFVATLDVPFDSQKQIGAGILHLRRGGRDSLLVALATLVRGAERSLPDGEPARR